MSRAPDYRLAERTAARLLEKHGVVAPPVDPTEIARAEGIKVWFVGFSGEYDKISGFFDPEENAIYVNRDEWPLRQTFTIAHELGHALLHADWAKSNDYKLLWRDETSNDRSDPHEKEANAFAARLLVPRSMLDSYYGLSPTNLSKLFAVSVPVIRNRLAFEYGDI